MQGDENKSSDGEEVVDLVSCLQITVSVFKLVTKFESENQTLEMTNRYLSNIGSYIVEVCQQSDKNHSAIRSQVYHLY